MWEGAGSDVVEPLRVPQLEKIAPVLQPAGEGEAAVEGSNGGVDVDVRCETRPIQLRTRAGLYSEGWSDQDIAGVLADRDGVTKQDREFQVANRGAQRAAAGFIQLGAFHHELQLGLHGETVPERHRHEPTEQRANLRGRFR